MYFKDLGNQWVILINSFFAFAFNASFSAIQRLINSFSKCFDHAMLRKDERDFFPHVLVSTSQVLMY